ncbi:MerR family transcriptional regulator [Streptomyces sp. NPDC048710]|uniref:MerR family transcriptional regulator n=1 Tax=unclassified Streptomyces TaxID=2593676 RepID=UPI003716C866
MRIAEPARRTGVPVPTIKFHSREGLLPPGERTGPDQVGYDGRRPARRRSGPGDVPESGRVSPAGRSPTCRGRPGSCPGGPSGSPRRPASARPWCS